MPERKPPAEAEELDRDLELEEALSSIARGALRLHRLLRASGSQTRILPFLQALSSLCPQDDGRN